jgi:hypothetical protein
VSHACSGRTVPRWGLVAEVVLACSADVDMARRLWQDAATAQQAWQARAAATRLKQAATTMGLAVPSHACASYRCGCVRLAAWPGGLSPGRSALPVASAASRTVLPCVDKVVTASARAVS